MSLPVTMPVQINLTGAVNFRDLGGYTGQGGCRVRKGLVYRSDSLADLTPADIEVVSALGLRTICDLRHETERAEKPNKALMPPTPNVLTIGFLPHRAVEMVQEARRPGATVAAFRAEVQEVYRRFAVQELGTFRHLFEILTGPAPFPLLLHCTSGKDRTGFATALVLLALGVSYADVLADYMLSNVYRRDLAYLAGDGMDPDLLAAMMEVTPGALEAGFTAAQTHWGSLEDYMETGLGLTEARRAALRNALLEPN